MPSINNLSDLFHETLRDIYYAEKKLLNALPKLADKASDDELADAFRAHLAETEGQVDRIEKVFDLIGKSARGKKCPAIEGLVEESDEVIKDAKDEAVRDAGLIATAQAVEHYEIARYGALIAWADELGETEIADVARRDPRAGEEGGRPAQRDRRARSMRARSRRPRKRCAPERRSGGGAAEARPFPAAASQMLDVCREFRFGSTQSRKCRAGRRPVPQIVTMSLNPTIDVASEADLVRPTHKIRTSDETYEPGGGGINVARVIAELGGDVEVICPAGGVTGAFLDELLGLVPLPRTDRPDQGQYPDRAHRVRAEDRPRIPLPAERTEALRRRGRGLPRCGA